jgi:hypothetical protein
MTVKWVVNKDGHILDAVKEGKGAGSGLPVCGRERAGTLLRRICQ